MILNFRGRNFVKFNKEQILAEVRLGTGGEGGLLPYKPYMYVSENGCAF